MMLWVDIKTMLKFLVQGPQRGVPSLVVVHYGTEARPQVRTVPVRRPAR